MWGGSIYRKRYKAEINVLHLLYVQRRSQRISKRVVTTEGKESKSNWTMCVTSSDHRWESQRGVWIQQCEKKTSVLSKQGSWYCWGQAHYTAGELDSICNVLGPKTGCFSKTVPLKRRRMDQTLQFYSAETTGRSTKAVPQTVMSFPLLVCSLSKWRLPSLGLREQF